MFHLKISISINRCKLINGVMLRLLQNILEIFKEVLNIILSVSIFIFYSFFFHQSEKYSGFFNFIISFNMFTNMYKLLNLLKCWLRKL
jgi:hypothetical protein